MRGCLHPTHHVLDGGGEPRHEKEHDQDGHPLSACKFDSNTVTPNAAGVPSLRINADASDFSVSSF
jgi:hypothetical protein